ncbi:MAG TPA: hypothetical protein VKE93_04315, partial [Candidatus Angelobacter sp.]|nr:hypothetical protein [Candidatus Angelobacter sp.]
TIFGVPYFVCLLTLAARKAPQALPPELQPTFDRGRAAAERSQWDLAIEYFAEVQKAANANPQVLFNLGRAHAEAGHDLTGILWLHAYLAADTKASYAEHTQRTIARLDSANQARVADILQQAISRAMQTEDRIKRRFLLGYICTTQAQSGDLESALKVLPSFQALGGELNTADLWKAYLESKAQAGQVQVAQDGLPHVRTGTGDPSLEIDHRVAILLAVFQFQKDAGDWNGARATIRELPDTIDARTRDRFFAQINHSKDEFERSRQNEIHNGCCGSNLALGAWLSRTSDFASPKSLCGDDLNLGAAIQNATAPSVKIDQAAENLADIANDLTNCSNALKALDAKVRWQTSHRRAP